MKHGCARTVTGSLREVRAACLDETRGKRVDRAVRERGREALGEPLTRTAPLRRGRGEGWRAHVPEYICSLPLALWTAFPCLDHGGASLHRFRQRDLRLGLDAATAVKAAHIGLWSGGRAEAHISRPRLVERQSSGRAGLGLLQRRMTLTAGSGTVSKSSKPG